MLPLNTRSSKLRLLFLVSILLLVLVGICYYTVSIYSYSLTVTSQGSPTDKTPREKEGYVYCASISVQPASRRPLTFQTIEVFDGKTDEKLAVDVFVYDLENQDPSDRGYVIIGHLSQSEWSDLLADRTHAPENFKTTSQYMWILPLFKTLPPQDHGARIVVKYKLYGIFPKEEEIFVDFS